MKIRKIFAVMFMMIMAFGASAQMEQMPPIPVDDAVRIGHLDNGLTYYIRHNDYPEHRVNFYIAQRVGSIQEEESQRGLAHFLEHMAFNGSKHFNGEGNSIIDYTRSLGVAFGKDLNAYTSIAETVYNINDVPSTRQSAIDSCLLILKDWSCGLLLTDEEIDKERGVIHEEWRMHNSGSQRMIESQLPKLYPGSKFGLRMPIGLMEVVDNFKYNELRDYYHKWYHPGNQALVIVGDVDVDHIEAELKNLFADVPKLENAAPIVDELVPDNEEPIICIDQDKEQQYSIVEVMFKHDATPKEEKSSMMYMLEDYAKDMMASMLNARLDEMGKEADCPYIQAGGGDGQYLFANTKDAFTLSAVPKEGMTNEATQAIVTEALRAAKFGFTETEYIRAREEYLSRLEKQYNDRNQISNDRLARQYYRNFLDNEPIPSIEQEYQIMQQIAPMLPVDLINQLLPELINTDGKNLVVLNFNQEKDGAVYPTSESLLGAVQGAENAHIEAYVDNVKQEPLIAKMPKKGKIVKETENAQFGYKELTLSNGARVILKKTDYKEDEIQMTARQRGGASLYGEEDWANTGLLSAITIMGTGLGNFSKTELEKAMAGKQAQVNFTMDDYFDEVVGQSTVKDLETLFQLTYLNFTAISKDEKAYNQIYSILENSLKNKDLTPESVFSDSVQYILNNYNWRNRPFGINELQGLNYDRCLEIAKERTANAANYTFYFVGNFDEATIRPLIEQYIASLPAKKGKPSSWIDNAEHPHGQTIKHFEHKSETPKAIAQVYWYDDQTPYSLENSVKADMLGQVLAKIYLQKIREDESAAYSAGSQGFCSLKGNRPFTGIVAYCPVKPEKADLCLEIMQSEIEKACSEIDETTLKEIKELMLKDHGTELKENDYWMDAIARYVDRGIDTHTAYEEIVNAQTTETLAAFARQLLNANNKVEVLMLPAE